VCDNRSCCLELRQMDQSVAGEKESCHEVNLFKPRTGVWSLRGAIGSFDLMKTASELSSYWGGDRASVLNFAPARHCNDATVRRGERHIRAPSCRLELRTRNGAGNWERWCSNFYGPQLQTDLPREHDGA